MSGRPQSKLLAAPPGEKPIDFIAHSPLFDGAWYVAENRSVLLSGLDPAEHYYRIGAHLGWNPGPDFDTLGYLAAHPDIRKAGMNPLAHFEKYGRREGRKVPAPGMPRIAPAQAVSASVVSARDWRMTRQEAERIVCASLAPLPPDTQPQRLLQSFDALAARRYVAAAAVLYDDNCAALKATIIMPTYDRSAKLMKAVRSVLDQSHGNFELLVVDDGSTDDTREQLDSLADDPRLRVFWNDHGGVSAARNTGLEHATGDYIFYLDSDNTWTPGYLKLMLAGLQATGTDCAYAASCILEDTGKLMGYRGEPFDWNACLSANYIDMNVMAHRADLMKQHGGFDVHLRRMVDWDLILRYSKDRDVAFFPFVGCMYLDHARDASRISVRQPYLYRKIVAEKNRLGLRSGAEALDTLSLSFGIKISAPYEKRAEWGDFHYAESLLEALNRLGHKARIDFKDDWYTSKARGDDVALVLRGLGGYTPRPGQLTLMWNISHPDQVPYEEYAECDQVMVASRSYAALLSIILEKPVSPLLQCTDTTRFHLPADAPPPDDGAKGVFIGNSRNQYRQMVRWSVENDIDIDIYGTRWVQFIPRERIAGTNIDNRQLGEKYRGARFVLNDHWQSMKDFGFVSNRIFDVVASGGRLISDRMPSLDAMFGDIVKTVDDEAGFRAAVSRASGQSDRRREAADYVKTHHSFDARAKALHAAVKGAVLPTAQNVTAEPDLVASLPRRRVGLLLQRGRAWWTSSAYIRLIGPLTTEHAYSTAGLDLVALDGPEDSRLETCDICIVQRIAVRDPDKARRLIETLRARDVPLYVDTDDAFFLHDDYRAADGALRLLMEAAREVWFSTETLAKLYDDVAAGKSRVRRNDLDPRFWQNYRNPPGTAFGAGPVRFVYMGTATHHGDFEMVLPVFERLARDYPGQIDLTLMGVTSTPPKADWLTVRNPPRSSGGYPAFVRFASRDLSFDVGIAPLVPSRFNAAKSDIKFLDYSAMGLLSVVSEGSVYQDCIDAGLAVGCAPTEEAWYEALAAIVERREDFMAMRERAAEHLWHTRNVLSDPSPLADLLPGGYRAR